MKKLLLFLGICIVTFALPYTGFMKLKPGSWAKYQIESSGKKVIIVNKYLGTTSYKNKKVNVIETEVMEDIPIVTQYWSAVDNDSLLKKVITKTPNGIMCMEEEMIGMMNANQSPNYHTKTPKKYSPQTPHIQFGTYKLPNGKKIRVAIFKENGNETWVSSEVPFGIVLVKSEGKIVMRLLDFGLKGAKPKISIEEAKRCTSIQLPFFQ